MTSKDSTNATSSQASGDGHTPSSSRDGTDLFGRAPAHVNPSLRPEFSVAQEMSAIYGPRGSGSSKSNALSLSLANRLREMAVWLGSTIPHPTWRIVATPWGRYLCQATCGAHSTLASGSGLLPTPSGTSNHGKNNVSGRLDEWGGSSNPFRGTPIGRLHLPGFELWMMGYPDEWRRLMPPATPSSRKRQQRS